MHRFTCGERKFGKTSKDLKYYKNDCGLSWDHQEQAGTNCSKLEQDVATRDEH